jgi:hypothetical protein
MHWPRAQKTRACDAARRTLASLTVVIALAAGADPASAQSCIATHCDALVSRLMIPGESCATQTYDPSQTVAYSRLVTGVTDFSDLSLHYPIRAFDDRFDGFFETDDPGFNAATSPCSQVPELSRLPASTPLYFDILTQAPTGGGAARSLLYWNAVDDTPPSGLDPGDVEWGPVPLDEVLHVVEGVNQATATGGTSEIEGYAIETTSATGGLHDHVDFRLRRAGGGVPTSGVYLLRLDLTLPRFAEGAPIYITFAQASPFQSEIVARTQVEASLVQPLCGDGVDNDRDGLTDFAGGDPGCSSGADASEKSAAIQCDDGIDNDLDGEIDFRAVDFGASGEYARRDLECTSAGDASESLGPVPVPALSPSGQGLLAALILALGTAWVVRVRAPRA